MAGAAPEGGSGGGTRRSLGTWDGISVVVGIVVGVSLFKVPALVFGAVSGPWTGLGIWLLGGALSLLGALCYAELASAYPRSGGDYVYLTRAYGGWVGFLFGWAQLVAVLTGSIGAMAYVFADYAVELWGGSAAAVAAAAVVALTALNLFGVSWGTPAQNALTLAKVVGLGGILAAGLLATGEPGAPAVASRGSGEYGFALVLVLYAYGGWSDAAYVAAEVDDPRRNVPRVLVLGTSAVAVLYLLVNAAYLHGLGLDGVRASAAPAAAVLHAALGPWGARAMSLLVMVSALGAIQGLIFTGSRVYASAGADHRAFALLGRWHPRLGAPVWALVVQGAVSLALILVVGTAVGRGAFDALLRGVGLEALPWQRFGGGFDTLVAGTAPVFWLFFGLTGAALPVLRWREPDTERPFHVPLYPWVPLAFCATSAAMLWASASYAGAIALLGAVPVAAGLLPYWASRLAGSGG